MKIITVLHSHDLGGAERHALGLMCALRDAGHDLLFAGPVDSWLAEQIKSQGIVVEHLPMHGFLDIASMLRLARIARRTKADIIHGHLTRGAHYAGIAGRLSGIPSIATAHSTNAGKHFGRVKRIIAASSAVRTFLLERGYPDERIEVIHHGLDIPALPPTTRDAYRARYGIPPDAVIFGMVARFVHDKGQDTVLKAFADAGIPGRLLLVGDASSPWGKAMRQLAGELALDDKALFTGLQNDVFPALAAMDVFLAPSRREALGLSLIEAAGMRLPLLGAAVGGIPEIVVPEHNGLLLPPDDIPAWSGAIQRLYDETDSRHRMGNAARATYEQRFSTARMMRATEDIYRRTVEGA